jgi:catechol 2,3-dioxygenase-like lactoylglutathione lyase family enzyme
MNETQPVRILSLHGVRYQVTDVARAAAFYTDHLGFTLEHQQLPAFASVLLGDFRLLPAFTHKFILFVAKGLRPVEARL